MGAFIVEFGYSYIMISIETDDILFSILHENAALKAGISGGIYTLGERPDDSVKEDVVCNCLALTQDVPQSGTSNVNIHVADTLLTIKGKQQYKAARERLRDITKLVIAAIKAARIEGLTLNVYAETIIAEPDIHQHYNNIRVDWNIQITD